MTELLLGLIVLGLFAVAYGILQLRFAVYSLSNIAADHLPKFGAILEAQARTMASLSNAVNEWVDKGTENA